MSLDEEAEKDIQHERCDEREDKDEEVKTDVFEHLSLDEEPEGASIYEERNDENEEEAKETIEIEQVNHKLESILAKVQCKLDTSTCRSEADRHREGPQRHHLPPRRAPTLSTLVGTS